MRCLFTIISSLNWTSLMRHAPCKLYSSIIFFNNLHQWLYIYIINLKAQKWMYVISIPGCPFNCGTQQLGLHSVYLTTQYLDNSTIDCNSLERNTQQRHLCERNKICDSAFTNGASSLFSPGSIKQPLSSSPWWCEDLSYQRVGRCWADQWLAPGKNTVIIY